jgi:hypothetical protein
MLKVLPARTCREAYAAMQEEIRRVDGDFRNVDDAFFHRLARILEESATAEEEVEAAQNVLSVMFQKRPQWRQRRL